MDANTLQQLAERAERLIDRLEQVLPAVPRHDNLDEAIAFRWHRGVLRAIPRTQALGLDDLHHIDRAKALLSRNTRQFLAGLPANNALLWGARGTGKSSLIRALLNDFHGEGLRVIEVDKHELVDLPDMVALLAPRPEKYLLFCDDLSFEADDPSYKALKATLDGSVAATPANLLIYATSNRRHLLPEYLTENLEARNIDGEIHHGEAVEEKISLSERFGLWVAFHPFSQEAYLDVVRHWLTRFGASLDDWDTIRARALRFALERGSRSGRVAHQFARDWAGSAGLRGDAP